MRDPAAYLEEIELALVSSPVVAAYEVLRAWANSDDGYVRLRATLVNGDFLEAAEYFVVSESQPVTIDYRHQWMDGTKQILRRRWDSTPDHPELANFPHHLHLNEDTVTPSQPTGVITLLQILEKEILPAYD